MGNCSRCRNWRGPRIPGQAAYTQLFIAMAFDLANVPPGREVYVLNTSFPKASDYATNYIFGVEINANPNARQAVFGRFRTPPETGELHVVRLAQP